MVEMVETAAILNQSGERALVILDEIGRGTATFDGLSIAWATVEHLHEVNRCRALFATHYHELTTLESKLDGLSCHSMTVKEWQGDKIGGASCRERVWQSVWHPVVAEALKKKNHQHELYVNTEINRKTL